MNLVLDIASSVEFWRQLYPLDRAPSAALPLPPTDCASRVADTEPLKPAFINDDLLAPTNGVLHVLSFEREKSRRHRALHVHAWSAPIPEGSFYQLSETCFVESPAFMFLRAAQFLNLAALIAFGDELCGLYSFDKREKRGFRKRTKPLATKGQIGQFLSQLSDCRGLKLAKKALRYVMNRSASPMETFDEMTMCLPYRYGGYGILEPNMNQRVDLTPRASRVARRNRCFLDMGYLEHKLDIEHHGKLDHSSDQDKDSDRERVAGLREMGIEVIELTVNEVTDLIAYEIIIKRIAGILGKRIRNDYLGPTPQRLALRKALFTWNHSSGKIC